MIFKKSLGLKISLAFLIVALIPFASILALFHFQLKQHTVNMIREGRACLCSEVGMQIQRTVLSAHTHIKSLAENPVIKSTQAEIKEKLSEMQKIHDFYGVFDGITLVSQEGLVLASTTYDYQGDWLFMKWFQQAIRGEAVVSPVHAILHPFRMVMVCTAPIVGNDGTESCILAGRLNMERIWEITDRVRIGETGFLFLTDKQCNLIACPGRDRHLCKLGPESLRHKVMAGECGITEFVTDQGVTKLCYHGVLEGHGSHTGQGWRIGVIQDADEAYAAVYSIERQTLSIAALGLVLIAALAGFVSRRIARPVRVLAEATQKIAKGDLSSQVTVEQQDEIGELAEAFNHMAEDLRRTTVSVEVLRESEKRFEDIVENTGDWIWEVDGEGRYTYTSPVVERALGYTPHGVLGRHFYDFLHVDNQKELKELIFAFFSKRKVFRRVLNRCVRSDGRTVVFETTGIPVVGHGGELLGYRGVSCDITERKRVEEALQRARSDLEVRVIERTAELARTNEDLQNEIAERLRAEEAIKESERELSTIFDSVRDGIVVLDNTGKITKTNRITTEIGGYAEEELIGKSFRNLGLFPADSLLRMEGLFSRGVAGMASSPIEINFTTREGKALYLEIQASPLTEDEKKLGIVAIIRNITKRRQAEEERKKLEAQLVQAQKMEAIGTLAGGIAHNFNNVLMSIQGNVTLMLLELEVTHPHHERLTSIEHQIESGAKLTSYLLGYARKAKYHIKTLDLNHLVEETCDAIGRTRKDVTIHLDLAEDVRAVEGDSVQIEQVVLNLCVNAADAMPDGGDLTLKTANVGYRDIKGSQHDGVPGDYVVLTVTDTGSGMDQETMERIFDPFFTTKERGRGTGLGLASTYGIIKAHGGYIHVESRKNKGTTFWVYLPGSDKDVPKFARPAVEIVKGTETVLLVDDEENIREVGKMLLERTGYTVFTARDGREAVELYRRKKHEIAIVLLDIVMPNMGGGEAYYKLKEINPHVKVLLLSGYGADDYASEILQHGCNGFIQKPFNIKELSHKIRQILRE